VESIKRIRSEDFGAIKPQMIARLALSAAGAILIVLLSLTGVLGDYYDGEVAHESVPVQSGEGQSTVCCKWAVSN